MLKQLEEIMGWGFELHFTKEINQMLITLKDRDGQEEVCMLPISDHLSRVPDYLDRMIETLIARKN